MYHSRVTESEGRASIAQAPAITTVRARQACREGLPRRRHKLNKIRHFSQARRRRVYQSCVPKSTDFAPPSARKFHPDSLGRSASPRYIILRQFPSICLPTGPPISLRPPAYPEHPSAYPLPTDHLCALRREPFEWQHERDACALDGPASPPSRRQPRRYSMSANSACPFGYRVTDVWPLPNCAPPSGQPSSEAHPPERFLSEPDNRGKCDHSYKR